MRDKYKVRWHEKLDDWLFTHVDVHIIYIIFVVGGCAVLALLHSLIQSLIK